MAKLIVHPCYTRIGSAYNLTYCGPGDLQTRSAVLKSNLIAMKFSKAEVRQCGLLTITLTYKVHEGD